MQSQSDRLEDQRSELGGGGGATVGNSTKRSTSRSSGSPSANPSPCVNTTDRQLEDEEDVTELVLRMQMGRLEEQRANFSPLSGRMDEVDDAGSTHATPSDVEAETSVVDGRTPEEDAENKGPKKSGNHNSIKYKLASKLKSKEKTSAKV